MTVLFRSVVFRSAITKWLFERPQENLLISFAPEVLSSSEQQMRTWSTVRRANCPNLAEGGRLAENALIIDK
jgi:hypothetical protein